MNTALFVLRRCSVSSFPEYPFLPRSSRPSERSRFSRYLFFHAAYNICTRHPVSLYTRRNVRHFLPSLTACARKLSLAGPLRAPPANCPAPAGISNRRRLVLHGRGRHDIAPVGFELAFHTYRRGIEKHGPPTLGYSGKRVSESGRL